MYDIRPYDPEAARTWIESARETSAEDAENAMTWLTNIGSGAATGAGTGAVAGPWGALIGALVGAGLGAAQTALGQQQQRPAQPRPAPRPAPPPRPAQPPRPTPQARPAPPPAAPPPTPAAQSDLSSVLGAVLTLLPIVVSAFGQRQAEAIDEFDSVLPDYRLEQAVEAAVLEALESAGADIPGVGTQLVREWLPDVVTALAPVLPSVLLGMEPTTTEARYAEWAQDGEGEFIAEGDESLGDWPAEVDDGQWTTPEWETEVTA